MNWTKNSLLLETLVRFHPILRGILPALLILPIGRIAAQAPVARNHASANTPSGAVVSVYERARTENWQWFASPPQSETYGYAESLLRLGISQTAKKFDWQLELSQPSVLWAPSDAVAAVPAQGQMGLGATYYAANGNQRNAAAAFLKQAWVRYNSGTNTNIRLGRFEFFEGQETKPANPNIAWLQANRIAQRLVGNFGFSTAQRSFDGLDAHYGKGAWDITAMAGRADQGVFNMNGNPELNVDLQYAALTRTQFKQHLLWRAFALGYHDGRTGVAKTDNRTLAARQADHGNVRIGTYGGNLIASIPTATGQFDLLAWGVLQNGQWGALQQDAKAGALEGGYQFARVYTAPWFRGGYFYGSGDTNASDNKHQTFFQVLPTPWIYAHVPFYNLMNSKDGFVQVVDHPAKSVDLRGDLHWLQLASPHDLWYLGGGAFDNKVFGYVGRPSNGHSAFATVLDVTSSWQATKNIAMNFCYGYANGKSVVASIYPVDHKAQFGYAELIYHWGKPLHAIR